MKDVGPSQYLHVVLLIVLWELEGKFNWTPKKGIAFEFLLFSKPLRFFFRLSDLSLSHHYLQHMAADSELKSHCASLWKGNTHFHEQISLANDPSSAHRVYIHWISHHVRENNGQSKYPIHLSCPLHLLKLTLQEEGRLLKTVGQRGTRL